MSPKLKEDLIMSHKKCFNQSGRLICENWDNFRELANEIAFDNNLSLDFTRDSEDLMTVTSIYISSTWYNRSGEKQQWAFYSHFDDDDKAIEEISEMIVDSYLGEGYFIEG